MDLHPIFAICHDGPVGHRETPQRLVEVVRPGDTPQTFVVLDDQKRRLHVHVSCLQLQWTRPVVESRDCSLPPSPAAPAGEAGSEAVGK